MKWLIGLLIGGANVIVWAFLLACCFKPQLWMALGPIVGRVLAVKGRVMSDLEQKLLAIMRADREVQDRRRDAQALKDEDMIAESAAERRRARKVAP